MLAGVDAETNNERMWASLAHVSTFSGYVVPMGHVLGPLVVYLIQKDRSGLAADQAKEALNFQISVTLYLIISLILCVVGIGLLMLIALVFFEVVCVIIATVRAHNGVAYRYPLTFRLVS